MLTSTQKKWIAHLSDQDKIRIVPFDPTAEKKFRIMKQKIQNALGKDTPVEHHGATSLGISGQDEIDIYIPVLPTVFDSTVEYLKILFGEPKSFYPLERVRFTVKEASKHVDVFLINAEHECWKNLIKFEQYLKSHRTALENYRLIKENGNGLNVREYYRRKIEFLNEILALAENVDEIG
jgi:GrpB-like predicted nucleotidyltransferase (UPF0157 family)